MSELTLWKRLSIAGQERHLNRHGLSEHLYAGAKLYAGGQGTLNLLYPGIVRPVVSADRDQTAPAGMQDVGFEAKLVHRLRQLVGVLSTPIE